MPEAPEWYPAWAGETIIIVASGPSAGGVDLLSASGQARFIAINNSWRLCPWAEILFAGDFSWWRETAGAPEFAGLKVSIDDRAQQFGVKILHCGKASDELVVDPRGAIGWGQNSGFGAFNLAVQLAPKRIVLVGYDMNLSAGLHWHGPHSGALGNPRAQLLERWIKSMEAPADRVRSLGIDVINCSPISALRSYPKMSFAEAIG